MRSLNKFAQRRNICHLGNIAADRVGTGSNATRCGIKPRLVATSNDNLSAFADEQLRCRQPHTVAAASDDSDLTV